MKRMSLALLTGALLAAGGLSAIAAAGGEGGHGKGFWGWSGWGGGGGKRGAVALKRFDADKDGAVSRDEFLRPRKDAFGALDANKDGAVDAAEFQRPMAERGEYRSKRMMKRLDANSDGRITLEEFQAGPRERFAEQDLNSDGKITADERPRARRSTWGWGGGGKDRKGERRGGDKAERSLEDVLERSAKAFEKQDANSDGAIDVAELVASAQARHGDMVRRTMHRQDKDKNGKVTEAEFLAKADKRFAGLDLNSDGRIGADDLAPGDRPAWNRQR